MSKAIQVYDDGKLVDISEKEVEAVQKMRQVYFAIKNVSDQAKEAKISDRNFISGLLRFAISFVDGVLNGQTRTASPDNRLDEKTKRIWDSLHPKIFKIVRDVKTSEEDRVAIAKFKKPFNQLSDAEKKVTYDDLDRELPADFFFKAITYCFLDTAMKLWTPKCWRLDAVVAKIAEVQKAETEKEKAETEKRVPVGSYQ